MCFKDNSEKEIMKKEGIVKNNDDLLKIFATAWKNLSDKDQAYWEEEARNDNVRFVQEKAVYKGPWYTPRRLAKKHPGAPKRSMSAFLRFSKGRRKTVKEENPDLCNTDVSRLLGEMCRNASELEKSPYVEAEIEERSKYKDVMQKWKDEQPQLNPVTQTSHESAARVYHNNFGAYGKPYASALPTAAMGLHSPPIPLKIIDNIKGMDSSFSHSEPPSSKKMMTMMTTTTEEEQGISVDDVNDKDILMGSRKFNDHPGNIVYRYNVQAYQPQLEAISDRTVAANLVIDHVYNDIGGRFLKVDSTNQWRVVSRLDVITKIAKALVGLKGNYISNAKKDRSIDDDDNGETFRFARV